MIVGGRRLRRTASFFLNDSGLWNALEAEETCSNHAYYKSDRDWRHYSVGGKRHLVDSFDIVLSSSIFIGGGSLPPVFTRFRS
jgi:hypothetical protein